MISCGGTSLIGWCSLQFDPAPRAGEPLVSRRVPDYFLVSASLAPLFLTFNVDTYFSYSNILTQGAGPYLLYSSVHCAQAIQCFHPSPTNPQPPLRLSFGISFSITSGRFTMFKEKKKRCILTQNTLLPSLSFPVNSRKLIPELSYLS